MRQSSAARQAVRQRLRSLDRGLRAPLETDTERLHRARVATRRLREALALCVPAEQPEPVANLRRLVRTATRALGGVRELDVALTLVDTLAAERPDLQAALVLVRNAIARERVARLERMRRQVTAGRLQRASRAFAEHLDRFVDDGRPADLLADRLLRRIKELRQATSEAALLYAPERLHRIRLATKKLRYALELAGDIRVASTKRLVGQLKRLQDHLGLLHDMETVAHHARRALNQPVADEAAAQRVAPALTLIEGRIHALHADYLDDREGLMDLLDRATAVCERLRR